MTQKLTRRQMLGTSALIGAGFWIDTTEAKEPRSPNEKLNLAVIGLGGRGDANLKGVKSENVVALCDVDDKRAGNAYERFPKAKKFYDFRRMLSQMDKQIDAVVISTPDHTHFHPAMMAMQMGKHCYCEKPMAHNVWEVREMTKLAREKKLVTQLGVQRHTLANVHRVVEMIQSGIIGDVKECHSWISSSRGMLKVPSDTPEVPNHLKWDLWMGPTKERAYNPAYVPYNWRFWWDYGTGETGNWGCHILDVPYWSLGLKYPTKVKASGPPVHPRTTPKSLAAEFEFPAEGKRPELKLFWYQVNGGPEILRKLKLDGKTTKGANNLFVGTKGSLLCGFGMRQLLIDGKAVAGGDVKTWIPKSPGFHKEWIQACKGGPTPTCHFDYSGPMTETVLLGNVAYRAAGEGFEWDAANLKTKGNEKAQQYVREEYREGWQI